MRSAEQLSKCWLDWYMSFNQDDDLTDDQISQALATAAKHYAVRFGIAPSRAIIHESQASGLLALMAQKLSIEILKSSADYNVDHILLSCCDDIELLEDWDDQEKE